MKVKAEVGASSVAMKLNAEAAAAGATSSVAWTSIPPNMESKTLKAGDGNSMNVRYR
jgi:hypothetical protein